MKIVFLQRFYTINTKGLVLYTHTHTHTPYTHTYTSIYREKAPQTVRKGKWFRTKIHVTLSTASLTKNTGVLLPSHNEFCKSQVTLFVVTCWVTKLYLTICDPMDHSLLGSTVHGISQARLLDRVAISFSWGSFQLRDQTLSPELAGGFFTTEPPGKPSSNRKSSL